MPGADAVTTGNPIRREFFVAGEGRTAAADAGIEQRAITNEEIVDRCIFALVNEGARILDEGMALRASDIDVVYLTGYGFPAWRGGPVLKSASERPAWPGTIGRSAKAGIGLPIICERIVVSLP